MIYTALDVALGVMLVVVTVYAIVLHRELRCFRGANAEYVAVLAQTNRAVEGVETAMKGIHDEAGGALIALGEQIDRAHLAIEALKEERRARMPELAPVAAPVVAPAPVLPTLAPAEPAAAAPAPVVEAAPDAPKTKSALAAERLLAKAAKIRAEAAAVRVAEEPAPRARELEPERVVEMPRATPFVPRVAALVEPEPEAAPVLAHKPHQWPTVRLNASPT